MSQTVLHLVSSILMHSGGGPVTGFEVLLFSLAAGVVILVPIGRGIVQDWMERSRSRKWPTVSAVIDVVSVASIENDYSHYNAVAVPL